MFIVNKADDHSDMPATTIDLLARLVKKSQQTFHKSIILVRSIFLIICSPRMAKGNCLMHACMAIIFAFIPKTFSIKATWLHFLFRIPESRTKIFVTKWMSDPVQYFSVAVTLFSKLMCFPYFGTVRGGGRRATSYETSRKKLQNSNIDRTRSLFR